VAILLRNSMMYMNETSSEKKKVKDKAIPVTRFGGPYGCEKLRLPRFLDNRLRWQ
jgi:hypothetical protein